VSSSSTLDKDVLAESGPRTSRPSPVERLRLVGVCIALFALALKQAPSQLVGDTKLDLSVDPVRFLARALHLWDPSNDFGVTQNQSYGYLFPMGPFFALGHLVGLPPWLVQRLWWGTLLCLAFLGVVALAERLGIGGPFSRLVGGLAFALSPRVLSTLGPISVETLPYCLAPWVLVPLVRGAAGGSPRKAAARSALVVACMGAVNAAAVLAALPPAALWLLTRERGPRRRALMRWWVGCVVLATTWWVVPLVLLARYSPPFLDFIESASNTTSVTSLVEVLRGTSDWVAYVAGSHGPSWPTGRALLTTPLVIVYTVLVVSAGAAGLLRRDLRERLWLTCCLVLGLVALTAGHTGPVTGLLAGPERQLLDGLLAPFRNVHKFDVVIRLPLVLGLVHVVSRLGEADPLLVEDRRSQRRALAVRVAAVAAVLGAAVPALSTGLAPRNPFTEIPSYWQQTATWLGQHNAQGRALLLPGSRFPDYLWGSTNDEPLQPLADSEWAVRGAVPLTPAGTIRYLDAVEQRLATGTPSQGLAHDLARAGIHYLVVRNDLAYGAAGSTRPLLVHEAVAASPGISRVATFGGLVGGGQIGGYVDEGLEVPYPAIEVYEVGLDTPRAELHPLSDVVKVAGGPESLLPLDDRFLLKGRPTVLQSDAAGVPALKDATTVLTDGLQRREVSFGGTLNQNTSPTLTADDPWRLDAPAHDYLPPGSSSRQTVARLTGARSVEASSSASDANALGGSQSSRLPFAAVDGDPLTSWRSDAGTDPATASWRLTFDAPREVSGLRISFDVPQSGRRPTSVRVRTDRGGVVVPVPPDGRLVPVAVPAGSTASITVSTATVRGAGLGYLGLSEVSVPGLHVTRTLDTTAAPGSSVIALQGDQSARRSCYQLLTQFLCSSTVGQAGEATGIDRTLHLTGGGSYRLYASAVPWPGKALNAVLDQGTGVAVTASSTDVDSPAARPGTVLDGVLGTGWRAAGGDLDPRLTITYPTPQTITGLRLQVQTSLAASRARAVDVDSPAGSRSGMLDGGGHVSFAPLVTNQLTVHLKGVLPATSLDPYTLTKSLLPVGVSELTVDGARKPSTPGFIVTIPCGAGPVIRVGNELLNTTVRTDRATLQREGRLTLTVCDPSKVSAVDANRVDVGDGTRVIAPASNLVRPVALTLRPAVGDALVNPAQPATPITLSEWGATSRRVAVPARDAASLLEVHENTNPGWVATLDGHRLQSVQVDGWQQGWVVPAGAAGTVSLEFQPDRSFRAGLLVGGAALALLLLFLVLPGTSVAQPVIARRPGRFALVSLAVGLALVGGWVAVAFCLLATLFLAGQGRLSRLRAALAPTCLLAAGLLLADHPLSRAGYAGRSVLPQVLCLAGVVLVWSAMLPSLPSSVRFRPNRRSFRRRAGRSTST
jgi:arabinofuranan 3-O-arabinosyltransferase